MRTIIHTQDPRKFKNTKHIFIQKFVCFNFLY